MPSNKYDLVREAHVLVNAIVFKILCEAIRWIVFSSDLDNFNLFLCYFVLKPKLIRFDVSHLAHTSPRCYANGCIGIGLDHNLGVGPDPKILQHALKADRLRRTFYHTVVFSFVRRERYDRLGQAPSLERVLPNHDDSTARRLASFPASREICVGEGCDFNILSRFLVLQFDN